jgi:predicted AlkP superfamily pyrophosphatase or phosphodiesterase
MCLLSLAIPLQGMAASTQIFCHGSGAVSSVSNKTADHSHHQVDDHHHGQTKPSDNQVSKVKFSKSANHKCSTCAQCCFGTALLPAPIKLVLSQEPSTFVATSSVLIGAISPLNLERPPRSFLA